MKFELPKLNRSSKSQNDGGDDKNDPVRQKKRLLNRKRYTEIVAVSDTEANNSPKNTSTCLDD